MKLKWVSALGALWFAISVAQANASCDPTVVSGYRDCVRIVDSLRMDKTGQARVFASDGSEFTGGQVMWMRGQLRRIDRACARGDSTEAQQALASVQELIKSHQHRSA